MPTDTQTAKAPWLEIIEGCEPVLLIAPHGGRAGPAASATLHPKVNDLHTAEITRELAARLGATALINVGMDRNALDCNRLGQLANHAPWLLEMIVQRLEELVARHGRALTILIHGWNVIEPRIDFGLGLRTGKGMFRAHGAACVSASDAFIHGPLANLAERLREHGIIPTVGLRYPAGGSQNLLQAFTERFRESAIEPLTRLARLAAAGAVDALQLEMSVALRWPGSLRYRAVEAIAETFSRPQAPARERTPITIIRTSAKAPEAHPRPPKRPAATPPVRLGMEFFDPSARIGVMASFDVGHSANGARFILLLDGRRVALFTSEGKPTHNSERIARGPLALRHEEERIALGFTGPALISPDSLGYLSVEHSLAAGTLQEAAEIAISLQPRTASMNLGSLLFALQQSAPILASPATFGSVTGRIAVDGGVTPVEAIGRIGHSFAAVGNVRFRSRRMLWAYFPSHPRLRAVEALMIHRDGTEETHGRLFAGTQAAACSVRKFELEAPSPEASPSRLAALLTLPSGNASLIAGEVESSLPLSRPGPDLSRLHTWLGFARFRLDGHEGAGMFEYSRCTEAADRAAGASDGDD